MAKRYRVPFSSAAPPYGRIWNVGTPYSSPQRRSHYHGHQYNRASGKRTRDALSYKNTAKMLNLVDPARVGVRDYWKQRQRLNRMGVTIRTPRTTNVRAFAKGAQGFGRQYGFHIAAGIAVAEASYLGARRIKRRRAARRTTASHNYQNKPPQLTKAQRQQMARRRRRVKGKFA